MATETTIDVVMPQMGVSVSEGTIVRWIKSEGEPIEADETLLEISTDKVDTEIPSPGSGVVQQILVQEGETVAVGTRIAVIAPEGAAAAPPAEQRPPAEEVAEEEEAVEPQETVAEAQAASDAAGGSDSPQPATAATENGHDDEHSFVSPVVARIASEHGIDPQSVPGTGRGGRVTKKDILAFIEAGPAEAPAAPPVAPPGPPAPAPAPAPAAAAPPAPPAPAAPVAAQAGEQLTPMSAMRRGIADHMRRSLDTAAHVTSAIEIDFSKIVSIRSKLKKEFESAYGVNPTFLAFIARATVDTLKDYPYINGEIRGDKIVTRQFVNLGIAVALDEGKGLIVPVLKNTEGMNLLGLARGISDLAARARDKKLLPEDVQGGTFTITNPGSFGTFHGTPVISQPQAGILGTYALVKRPWVIQDALGQDVIAIRPIMNLTLTYDHRLVDGAYAGQFLRDLRKRLETWDERDY